LGLDGLSIGNLGLNRDKTSKEHSINAEALSQTRGVFDPGIDQLDKKQAISTEDHDNPSFSGGFTEEEEEKEEELEDTYEGAEFDHIEDREYQDYKFTVVHEEGMIYVNDAESGDYVAEIPLSELGKIINSMKQPSGIIVNRKV